MKKLVFAFFTILSCAAIMSCNSAGEHTGGTSTRAKKNLESNQAILKMFETGDFSKMGDYIASDAVDHSGPTGPVKGLDSIKAMFQYFTSTMSDTKVEVIKELADDDYVMCWIKQTWTAKIDDPMMSMKAGDKGSMQGVEVTKYNADGKVTDHWGFISMAEMMKMMPQPTMDMNKPDTTGKK